MKPTGFASLRASGMAALAAASASIAVFYTLLWRQMRDLPIVDDYHAILQWVLTYRQLPSAGSKFAWLFAAQHNDYKLVVLNVLTWLQWKMTGHIHFEPLILLGNFMVLAILALLWKHSFPEVEDFNRRVVLFLPVVFLLFAMNYAEMLDFALTDVQHVPSTFFSMAALHFLLSRKPKAFAWACACVVLGCFSSVNAFLVAPIGFVLLAYGRRWRDLAVWCALLAATGAAYAYDYHRYNMGSSAAGAPLTKKILFLLSLTGGAFENMSHFPVRGGAIAAGAVMIAVLAYALTQGFGRTHTWFVCCACWVLLTEAVITQGRGGLDISLSLPGRYKLFSDLLLIICYVYGVEQFTKATVPMPVRRVCLVGVLVFTAIFALGSDYFGNKFLANRRTKTAQGVAQFEADPERNSPTISLDGQGIPQSQGDQDRRILYQSIQAGFYTLPRQEAR